MASPTGLTDDMGEDGRSVDKEVSSENPHPKEKLQYGRVSILANGGSIEPGERLSVFDRLNKVPDERLKFREGEKTKLQFAEVVGGTQNPDLQFFPLEDKSQTQVRIPIELARQAAKSYHSTLFGYFLGPRLHFPVVKRFAQKLWGKFGFLDAMLNANGVFFFKFNDAGGAMQVMESGPIMIQGIPLFVFPWDPTKGIMKPEHTTCPLWVKLHNIPLVAFNKEGISRIASALGVPKQMDACTASMCDKAWGRPGFAKVLVEVWAVGDLKRKLEIVIPSLNGGNDVEVAIDVEYLWEPTQCSHCLVFGHKLTTCPKVVRVAHIAEKSPRVDEDGFQRVQRKHWRTKSGEKLMKDGKLSKEASSEATISDPGNIFRDTAASGSRTEACDNHHHHAMANANGGELPDDTRMQQSENVNAMQDEVETDENVHYNDVDIGSKMEVPGLAPMGNHSSTPLMDDVSNSLKERRCTPPVKTTNRFRPLMKERNGERKKKKEGMDHKLKGIVING